MVVNVKIHQIQEAQIDIGSLPINMMKHLLMNGDGWIADYSLDDMSRPKGADWTVTKIEIEEVKK